uniref:GINS subunit domain-containing protein n=1 Tax=Theileria parva TaxID=5875 RepID=Q4MZH7_THEPA|eukprot:XP_763570.1 hypothetical protein [Theileria parva strain Muguga]
MSDILKNIQELILNHKEFNNSIDLILRSEDEIELPLFYAKHLYKAGLCKIEFPSYYKSARALFTEPTATTVGLSTPFYFELAYELCQIIPENEWPVENLLSMLKEAECKRRNFLIKRSTTVDGAFLSGLTHEEKKRKSKLSQFSVLNVLSTANINLLCLNLNSLNTLDFYELDD